MQTGYNGVQGFSTRLPFDAGICEWFYTPRENINGWPDIDPVTQYLVNEPMLIGGATWYGPIKVPDNQLGFEETQKIGKAGIFYNQKVSAFHAGDSATSRVNMENMPYHEYVIVAKLRAGHLYVVIGNNEKGLDFNAAFVTGQKKVAGTEISFSTESIYKAYIITEFLGFNVTPPPDYLAEPYNPGAGIEEIRAIFTTDLFD